MNTCKKHIYLQILANCVFTDTVDTTKSVYIEGDEGGSLGEYGGGKGCKQDSLGGGNRGKLRKNA